MNNTPSSAAPNAHSLFASAASAGVLTPGAQAVLVPSMTAGIQAAISGTSVDDVAASSVVLIAMGLDDSGSMADGQKDAACRDGANLCLDAVGKTKEADGILVHLAPFNDAPICPFVPIANAPRLTASNYKPVGGTPLYDMFATLLAATIAKSQEFADNGVPCRGIVLVATDGMDQHSVSHRTPESVEPLVKAALNTEMIIVAFLGIGNYDFRSIARRMGIEDRWILTEGDDPHSIRRAFMMASKSMVRASQAATGGNFGAAAGGGFASP